MSKSVVLTISSHFMTDMDGVNETKVFKTEEECIKFIKKDASATMRRLNKMFPNSEMFGKFSVTNLVDNTIKVASNKAPNLYYYAYSFNKVA